MWKQDIPNGKIISIAKSRKWSTTIQALGEVCSVLTRLFTCLFYIYIIESVHLYHPFLQSDQSIMWNETVKFVRPQTIFFDAYKKIHREAIFFFTGCVVLKQWHSRQKVRNVFRSHLSLLAIQVVRDRGEQWAMSMQRIFICPLQLNALCAWVFFNCQFNLWLIADTAQLGCWKLNKNFFSAAKCFIYLFIYVHGKNTFNEFPFFRGNFLLIYGNWWLYVCWHFSQEFHFCGEKK